MITLTETDGVPTLIAATEGPMAAGLLFRVGIADETLPVSGITHLVEHLALHRHGLTDYHYNGTTSATETLFSVQGSSQDVTAYLHGVCHGLADLPLDRLETEKTILDTEANGRRLSLLSRIRHGASGYGLAGYPEWGLHHLRAEDLRQWAATWFTRANAVLWIAGGQVPPDLRLNLPDGRREPLPELSAALSGGPAFVTADTDLVMFDGLVERGAAAMLYAEILERRLFRDLRLDGGYSYAVNAGYERRGGHSAVITAVADAHPDAYNAVIGAMVDALASQRAGHIDPSDVEAVRSQFRDSLKHPEAEARRLPAVAADLLAGRPIRQSEDLLAEIEAVDLPALARVAGQSWDHGLLLTAGGRHVGWTGFTGIGTLRHPVAPITGRRFPARDDADVVLVLGNDGVALQSNQSSAGTLTVPFAACAALMAWPDGARQLVGTNGVSIAIEPTRFGLDSVAVGTLTAAAHPSRLIWMPPRDPSDIPTEQSWRPVPVAAPPSADVTPANAARPPGKGSAVGMAVLGVLAVPLSLLMLVVVLGSIGDPEVDAATWVVLVFLALVPVSMWVWIIRIARRRRLHARTGR